MTDSSESRVGRDESAGDGTDGPDGLGLRIGIVASRFNAEIVDRLVETAQGELGRLGVRPEDVILVRVPGAFELPIAAQALLRSAAPPDAVVCLGAVIRGETPHFDFVAGAAADGIVRVGLNTGRPVIFGVLTTNTLAQARDRADGSYRRGADAARDAVEMARLLAGPEPPTPAQSEPTKSRAI